MRSPCSRISSTAGGSAAASASAGSALAPGRPAAPSRRAARGRRRTARPRRGCRGDRPRRSTAATAATGGTDRGVRQRRHGEHARGVQGGSRRGLREDVEHGPAQARRPGALQLGVQRRPHPAPVVATADEPRGAQHRRPRAGQGRPAVGHVARRPLVDRDRRRERRGVLAVVGHEPRGAGELDDEGGLCLVDLEQLGGPAQLAHAQAAAAQHAGRGLLPEADQPGDEQDDPLARGGRLGRDERGGPVRSAVGTRRRDRGRDVRAAAAQRQGDRRGAGRRGGRRRGEQAAAEQPVDGRRGRGVVGRRQPDRRTPQQGVQHRARAGGCRAQERGSSSRSTGSTARRAARRLPASADARPAG